jgi:hypothetical protein
MSSSRRLLTGALFCTSLLGGTVAVQAAPGQVCYFGECMNGAKVVPAPQQAAPSNRFKIVAQRGSWAVVSDGNVVMVVDRFENGSKLAILKSAGKYFLVLTDPGMKLREGESLPVQINVDGTNYMETARAVSDKAAAVEGLKVNFLRAFFNGEKALVRVGKLTWTLSLVGAAQAIDDAAALE